MQQAAPSRIRPLAPVAPIRALPAIKPRRPFAFWPTLGVFAVSLLILAFATNVIDQFFHGPAVDDESSAYNNMADVYAYLAMAAFIAWRLPSLAQATWRDIGVRVPRLSELAQAVTGVGLSSVFFVLYSLFVLQPLGLTHHVQAGFEGYAIRSPLERLTAFLCMSVADPIGEELLFRATLLAAIASRFGTRAGVIVSGLIFGAIHGDGPFFAGLAFDGIVFGTLYARTRNIFVPMFAHGLSNALTLF
jgi:membrane protease YdiL (CAAX protease family)